MFVKLQNFKIFIIEVFKEKLYKNHSLCQIYKSLHIAAFYKSVCPQGKGRCCSTA